MRAYQTIYTKKRKRSSDSNIYQLPPIINPMSHKDNINCVIYVPVGEKTYFVSGGGDQDRSIRVWDSNNYKLKEKIIKHRGEISALLHINKLRKNVVLSSSTDKSIRVWDALNSWSCLQVLLLDTEWVREMSYIPTNDKRMIVVSLGGVTNPKDLRLNQGKELKVWNLNEKWTKKGSINKKLICSIEGHKEAVFDFVLLPPISNEENNITLPMIASISKDKVVPIHNLETGELIRKLEGHKFQVSCLTVIEPSTVCDKEKKIVSPLLATGSLEKIVKFWNPYRPTDKKFRRV